MEALNVDEVVGQLLASEGFTSVEELALVDVKELAGIEGFDDETATELQSRAREYLEQLETELENKRKELGVDDALKTVPGVTSKMLVKFGENDIKTVEDLAGCATDDLVGWTERKEGGEPTKHPGILDANEISRDDAESMIMQARVHRRLDHRGRSRQDAERPRRRRTAGLRPSSPKYLRHSTVRRCVRNMSHACLPSLTPISTTDRGPTGPRRRGCARSRGRCGRSTS